MATKTKVTYAAMPGGCLNATTAITAGKELARIEKKHGAIKPADVVTESRPEEAPLHPHFTWDDSVAAEKWREDEARAIIRSVRVIEHADMPHAEQPVIRCFVNVRASDDEQKFDGCGYIGTMRAVKVQAYRDQVLAAAKAEIKLWQRKYADLLTFAGANGAIDTLLGGLSAEDD